MFWANKQRGFTIVELLIVVVVIAILAAITIVAYNGITRNATNAARQSEASQAAKKLETIKIRNGNDAVPTNAEMGIDNTSPTLKYYPVAQNNTYCLQSSKDDIVYSSTNVDPKTRPVSCADQGLIGWWKFNGDANDSSTNSFNGTITAATATNGQNGQANSAMNFVSANTTSVRVTNNAILTNDAQTFSFWVNPTNWSTATASTILAKRGSAANGYFISYINGLGALVFDCGGSSVRWNTGYAPPLNTWTHIVFTCSSNTGLWLYVNGVATNVQSTIDKTNFASSAELRFGMDSSSSTLGLNGSLDDVRIYNRVLTQGEAEILYRGNAQ